MSVIRGENMTRQGATRKATKEKGVYELVSETKFTKSSRGKTITDVCYYIAYKLDGKLTWEKIGWISEGYSVIAAAHVRGERLRTIRHREELPQQKAKAPTFKTAMEKYLAWADTNKANGRTTDNYLYQGHKGETGHRTLTMTTRYSHLTGDHKRRAAERLEQAFSGSERALNIETAKIK
jgi:hypothetical protein